jgi:hypothetical protein
MAKIQLVAAPTFKAVVDIPVPGGKPAGVQFTFKARTKAAFKEFLDSLTDDGNQEDPDVIMSIASGWELDDPFDRDNVDKLVQNYIGSSRAIIEKYITELTAARAKN